MRTIDQIDQAIDANRCALMGRVHCSPECSALAWQNAWDRCPDLHQHERALFLERGMRQQENDRISEREYQAQRRRRNAAAVATLRN